MTTLATLECDHCGGDAIVSDARGMFRDGDGTACMTCGYPGSVSVDVEDVSDFDNESEENVARWSMREEPGDFCRDPTCEECKELVAAAVGVTT